MECNVPACDVNLLVRCRWGIEKGLHYRRDETLREDWCYLKQGQTPTCDGSDQQPDHRSRSALGRTNLAEARRYFVAHRKKLADWF